MYIYINNIKNSKKFLNGWIFLNFHIFDQNKVWGLFLNDVKLNKNKRGESLKLFTISIHVKAILKSKWQIRMKASKKVTFEYFIDYSESTWNQNSQASVRFGVKIVSWC